MTNSPTLLMTLKAGDANSVGGDSSFWIFLYSFVPLLLWAMSKFVSIKKLTMVPRCLPLTGDN